MNHDPSTKSIFPVMQSTVQGKGRISNRMGDFMEMKNDESAVGEKMSILFLGKEALPNFASSLFSDKHKKFHNAPERATAQSFDDCYLLAEEFERLLGFEQLSEDSPMAIHFDEISKPGQVEDIDLQNSCLVIVCGGFEKEEDTKSAFEMISETLSKSILVNCSDFTQVQDLVGDECILINQKLDTIMGESSRVNVTLAMIQFMLSPPKEDVIPDIQHALRKLECLADIEIPPSSSSKEQKNWQKSLENLKNRQIRSSKSFDRRTYPHSYEDEVADRLNFDHWLDSIRKDLYSANLELLEKEVVESLKILNAIWKLTTNQPKSSHLDEEKTQLLEFWKKQCLKEDLKSTLASLNKFYGQDIKSNNAFYGKGIFDASSGYNILGNHAKFMNWSKKSKDSNLYNFSPYLWNIFEQINVLVTANGRYGSQTETPKEEYQYWISPTRTESFNHFQLNFEIRRRFLEFKEHGGYLGWKN